MNEQSSNPDPAPIDRREVRRQIRKERLGETEFRFTFSGDNLEVAVEQVTFGAKPMILKGTR